jgi:FkbM family methyltransferase
MINRDAVRMLYRAWRYRWKLDRQEIRFARGQLRPGDTAVDIGAHKGAYAYWMHRAVMPGGRVVCFEPQPELARYLGRMKSALRLDRLEVENRALSSRGGEMALVVPGGRTSPGGTLEAGLIRGEHATYPVPVTTLDDHFGADAPVRLIKCDVEGHELEVFRGGERLLRSRRPILLFECEERHHRRYSSGEVFAFLEALGYQGFFFSRAGAQPLAEFDPVRHGVPSSRDYANNFAFLPSGGTPR